MSTNRCPEPGQYVIRVRGHLPPRWAAWFEGMALTTEGDGTTVLSGPVVDQSALHGLLQRVRDMGLPLVSVVQVDPGQSCPPPSTAPWPGTRSPAPSDTSRSSRSAP